MLVSSNWRERSTSIRSAQISYAAHCCPGMSSLWVLSPSRSAWAMHVKWLKSTQAGLCCRMAGMCSLPLSSMKTFLGCRYYLTHTYACACTHTKLFLLMRTLWYSSSWARTPSASTFDLKLSQHLGSACLPRSSPWEGRCKVNSSLLY